MEEKEKKPWRPPEAAHLPDPIAFAMQGFEPMVGKRKAGNGNSIIGRTVAESEHRKSTLPRRTMAGF